MCCSHPVKRKKARISNLSHLTIYACFFASSLLIPPTPFSFSPICLSLSLILLSLHFYFLISLPSFKWSLTWPCTITKQAWLFMLHRGITLFLLYYFSVKSPRYDLPQTALRCPTLIIFSHSTTPGHNETHAPTFPSHDSLSLSVCLCVCISVLI